MTDPAGVNSRPNRNDRPLVGITMGEPAGIGAEVVVKALADPAIRSQARFIVYGMDELMNYAADLAEVNPFWFRLPHEEVDRVESGVVVADYDEYTSFGPAVKQPTAEGGHASIRFVDDAIAAGRTGRIDAVVTGPIHKVSWKMAGLNVPGHTEYIARLLDTKRVAMMFVGGGFRIALASTHVPLFELRNRFTIGYVFQPIDLLHAALQQCFGIAHPRIAVAALNPHASEEGRFGDEERRIIEPAMVMAREAGIDVEGPFPADTLFWMARGRYDGVVAMYHDQGLIPIKMAAFDSAVNVTIGLPIIRTSVGHGTGFDIAGRNRANPGSMKAAISLACQMANTRAAAAIPPGSK